MILRSLELERFGPFAGGSFEFRRGLNLVAGPNDSGKTALAAALSGVLFGLDDASSWARGEAAGACRGTLVLENGQRIVRISRDFLSDAVELEERDALHQSGDRFRGTVPRYGGDAAIRDDYRKRLRTFFNLTGERFPEDVLRFLLGAPEMDAAGRLPELLGVEAEAVPPAGSAQEAPAADEATLEELRRDYNEGARYLDWARNKWAELEEADPDAGRNSERLEQLRREREELCKAYHRTGLPDPLPEDLPVLLAEAAEIRQELVAVGGETAGLREQLLALPRWPWRGAALVTVLLALAAGVCCAWLSAGCVYAGAAALAGSLAAWGWAGSRGTALRAERARLQGRGGALEGQRAAAQERLAALDERFEALGLSPSAVAVARMQKNLEQGRRLQGQLARIDGAIREQTATGPEPPPNLLGREELAAAEKTLAELGERIRRLERQDPERAPAAAVGVAEADRAVAAAALDEEAGRLLRTLAGPEVDGLAVAGAPPRLLVGGGERRLPLERTGRGTRSAVRLTLRLALLGALETRGALPLVLDEPCAGLDRARAREALRVLERLAASHQVILCSHDENLLKRAARDRWHVVSLAQDAGAGPKTEERRDDAGQLHLL